MDATRPAVATSHSFASLIRRKPVPAPTPVPATVMGVASPIATSFPSLLNTTAFPGAVHELPLLGVVPQGHAIGLKTSDRQMLAIWRVGQAITTLDFESHSPLRIAPQAARACSERHRRCPRRGGRRRRHDPSGAVPPDCRSVCAAAPSRMDFRPSLWHWNPTIDPVVERMKTCWLSALNTKRLTVPVVLLVGAHRQACFPLATSNSSTDSKPRRIRPSSPIVVE